MAVRTSHLLIGHVDIQGYLIGGGVLGDIWLPEQRGKAVAIYSLAPLLSPVMGPVSGGW